MASGKALAVIAAALSLGGCAQQGKVDEGRVIAFDRQQGRVTLIRDSTAGRAARPRYDLLPPVTIEVPRNPEQMGPAPQAGGLFQIDLKARHIVLFDSSTGQFRTISYTPLEERSGVSKAPTGSSVDRARNTITVYAAAQHTLVTFAASADLLALPDDTWKEGDVVRYYYKDPARALRLMNVTRTDITEGK